MKHVVSLLLIALCASALQALTVAFRFTRASTTPFTYADDELVINGEKMGVVFALLKSSAGELAEPTQIPFSVDAVGQLTVTDANIESVEWATLTTSGSTVTTIPFQDDGTVAAEFRAITSNTSTTSAYCYVVLFDSRASDGTTYKVSGSPVGNVAIAPVGTIDTNGEALLLSNVSVYLPVYAYFVAADTTSTSTLVNFPGQTLCSQAPDSSWQNPAAITSLTVDGTTYDSASSPTLDEYLTPAVSGLSLDSTSGTLTLTGSSSDATFYTVKTKASLSDEKWVPLTEFLTSSGKTLDTAEQMYYSRMRLDTSGTAIEIPIIEGETTRFYRFEPIGSSNSSSEE